MEQRKFSARLSGVVFALSLLVSAYGADAQIPEKVRLGISDVSFTFLPHLVAKDTGIFQKRGLQVEVIARPPESQNRLTRCSRALRLPVPPCPPARR
jgi:ABC-type nitrate/sulfonate/bicarbonate transport system substrate-binding protein